MSDRPDDLRRQLATLWRAAQTGWGTMREVVVRSSQSGRLRFDIALLQRERSQLLERLGERTCEFIDSSGGELPDEIIDLHDRIRDLEGRIRSGSARAHDNAFGAPRGFEPEAAVDYGEDDAPVDAEIASDETDEVDEVDEHAEAAVVTPPAAARRSKRTPPRRKSSDD